MALDRRALVARHSPRLTAWDPYAPLTVGNGELAFTADVTGLQTFDEEHRAGQPLCTLAQWGWHTRPAPRPSGAWSRDELRLEAYDTGGRTVGYATSAEGQEDAFRWLRENPHRLHLGRVGLVFDNGRTRVGPGDLGRIDARLDLWTGLITSRFEWEGRPVEVTSCCHPDRDLLWFTVESPLVAEGRLGLRVAFPYGSHGREAADWASPDLHESHLVSLGPGRAAVGRRLDATTYRADLAWGPRAALLRTGPHEFHLGASLGQERLEMGVAFGPGDQEPDLGDGEACRRASARWWEAFWRSGAAVDLAGSADPRAGELERRIVLSQYLLAVQCAGSLPPQETGLSGNSWYGKFHLEMHWWHAAWFPLWGRPALLERSLGWYRAQLPAARDRARAQGYRGARWPKMVGPAGEDCPSAIAPLLIWQQPHLLHLAELLARARPEAPPEAFWDELVAETADFMVSFAAEAGDPPRLHLGPPVIPAQENHDPRTTRDPTFELAYWDWGLRQADAWFRRRGLVPDPAWVRTADRLAPLPAAGGIYQAHGACPDTFAGFHVDHPSMLGALGVLPGRTVDRAVMARTLDRVWADWTWDEVWGWDFPLVAMTAARLGRPDQAVEALLHPSPKNTWSANGHNRQGDVEALPVYLPGNGGLLAAVALMAGGWDGAPGGNAPGFPPGWRVRHEGLVRFP